MKAKKQSIKRLFLSLLSFPLEQYFFKLKTRSMIDVYNSELYLLSINLKVAKIIFKSQ
jgi:hypothetical protein